MLIELALSTVMVLVTIAIHGAGLLLLDHMLRIRDQRRGGAAIRPMSVEGAVITAGVALGLLVLHGLEIWTYASLFHVLGAVDSLRDAVYFSTITYASIGFSDTVIREEWRLLGAIEGINGALLLGWSVAFFVPVMTRIVGAGGRRH